MQMAVVNAFGSDASISLKAGHVGRGACVGFPTKNTHGYEVADLCAIERCVDVLEVICNQSVCP